MSMATSEVKYNTQNIKGKPDKILYFVSTVTPSYEFDEGHTSFARIV